MLIFHRRKGYGRFRAMEGWPETAMAWYLIAGPLKAAAVSRHVSEAGLLLGRFQPHLSRRDLSRHQAVTLCAS